MRNELRSLMGEYLSTNEFIVLKNIDDGTVKASDLSKALNVSASHITTITDSLFEKDLISRQRSSSDRRVVFLILTSLGKELIVKIEKRKSEYFKNRFDVLSEMEVEQFITLFKKMDASKHGHD
ncbi:MarR family transcriptional regulator [Falsibacillus albus]|uniref:MarR family transcriptional regulator n=2 Tax=Falsibacillus albus TaxID=2478915 RepID=A0A3L7JYR2_9BACI|nr:MarR family transcriptional regulator [Falsibacillus albus]